MKGSYVIRTLVAEPMPLVRAGLVACLSKEDDIDVLAGLEGASQVITMSCQLRPHVAVIGAELPERDGFSVASDLHRMLPALRVLILAVHRNPCEVRRAAAAHVAGIVVRDAAPEIVAEAVRSVSKGTKVIDPDLAFAALSMSDNPLTSREIDALRCAAEGATTAEIARCLGLSVGTVRNYVSRAIAKTGARNRVDAIRIAEGSGWLYTPGPV